MTALVVLLLITCVLILFFVVRIANELGQGHGELRRLNELVSRMSVYRPSGYSNYHGGSPMPHGEVHLGYGCFLIWEWRQGAWCPLSENEAGNAPPAYAGAFEGDIAKTWVADNR